MSIYRIPYVTLVLFVFYVIMYFVAASAEAPYKVQVETRERDLVSYYTRHPNLTLPQSMFEKLSPGSQQLIALSKSSKLKVGETLAKVDDKLALMEHFLNTDDPSQPQDQQDAESMQAIIEVERKRRQGELDVLVGAFEESLQKSFYKDFGFIPARGGLKTMFTSMFLHYSFWHLAFNMLLLVALGTFLEKAWRSLVFPIFYLSGGIFATIGYKLSVPDSTIPLIGAAGAIAALTAAFAVRSYDKETVGISLMKGIGALIVSFAILFGHRASLVSGNRPGYGDIIAGVLFGALVAFVFRLTNFEHHVLTPKEERKTETTLKHLAVGLGLLDDGKFEEAIEALKQAVKDEPDNAAIHKELCKAYSQTGKRNLTIRKFKQTIYLRLKQGELEAAADDYVELSEMQPEMILDAPQQLKIARALENRAFQVRQESLNFQDMAEKEQRLFTKAALAYRDFISYQQRTQKTVDTPETIEAVVHYADICARYLNQPKDAYKAYQIAMQSSQLSAEQKKALPPKAQRAMQMMSDETTKTESLVARQKAEKAQQKGTNNAINAPAPAPVPRPNIPLQKRIKLVQEIAGQGKYPIKSVAPLPARQALPVSGGMTLKRGSEPPVLFQNIYAVFVTQLPEEQEEVRARRSGRPDVARMLVMDIFLAGQARPYRLRSDQVAYPQFFKKLRPDSVENFRQFLLHIITQINSVYIDQGTFEFLKSGDIPQFSGQQAVETHERNLWQQLAGAVRFHCDQCWEVYWVDSHKIPEKGAKTKCAKCGNALFVQQMKHPT